MLRLGPLLLDTPLGSGAWGVVWRGRRGDLPVAVKVLRADIGWHGARAQSLLEDEIRVMARLDHPAIAPLLDHGVVPPEAAAPLVPGSPYLVMPLADGTLDQRPRLADARGFLAVVGPLLNALAHIHARGLVHRDVKPANVLVFLRPERVVLGDLGIAWDEADGPGAGAGTARYMPPEQAEGRWRMLGPWSDLFALGRLGRELLSGDPDGVEADFPVPDAWWRWLDRLTDPDPLGRFRTAGEARGALPFGEGSVFVPFGGTPTLPAAPATTDLVTRASSHTWSADDLAEPVAARNAGSLTLREPPLTGRTELRERLWHLARTPKGARTVILHGPPGRGASRLARWVCEGVEEAGVAATWRFRVGEGLARGVRRRLRAEGLEGPALRAHLRARGAPDSLAELLERHTLSPAARAARVLAALEAEPLPTVVWLDGVDDDEEAAALAGLWTERGEPSGLLVATAAAPPSAPGWEGAEHHLLEPLPDASIAEMLECWLGLSPRLAVEIAARAEGSPLLAREVAADLARRGALVPGPLGWVQSPDASVALPDTVQALWSGRIEALGLDAGGRRALAAAAVLGEVVDIDDWRALAGADVGPARRALLDAGLAHPEGEGMRFARAQLRQSLQEGPDQAALHALAAARLAARGADPGDVGMHLFAAGARAEALAPLCLGAQDARARRALWRAARLADHAMVCAELLAETDPRRADAWQLAGRARADMGEFEESARLYAEAHRLALCAGAAELAGVAAFGLADAANQAGDGEGAARWLDAADAAYARAGSEAGLAYVGAARASLARRLGRGAEGLLEAALAHAERAGAGPALGAVWLQIGNDASALGNWGAADAAYANAGRFRPESPMPLHALATSLAKRGDRVGALELLGTVLERTEAEGGSGAGVATNIAQLYAELGRVGEARALAERWIPRLRRAGRRPVLGNLLGVAAASALCLGDEAAFDAWAREAEAIWRATRLPDLDVAALLDRIAGDARDASRAEVARDLARLARALEALPPT